MTQFNPSDIRRLRQMKLMRYRMAAICETMAQFTRDELVEALDAIVRHQDDFYATDHVNRVLALQSMGVPLVNGKPLRRDLFA